MNELVNKASKWIKESQNIVVLIGAGVSVSCGIPDFRSPGGVYDILQPELLTATKKQRKRMQINPTYVLSRELFLVNQFPYLELRKPFILGLGQGKWKPSPTHFFFEFLNKTNKLRTLYSQNIDGLEFMTGIEKNKIISCHGSLTGIGCEFCEAEMERTQFLNLLKTNIKNIYSEEDNSPKESKNINCDNCNKSGMKPTTVLYGSNLPTKFFKTVEVDNKQTDLILIIGTSLEVGPANSICNLGNDKTKRIFINLEEYSSSVLSQFNICQKPFDLFLKGKCDEIVGLIKSKLLV